MSMTDVLMQLIFGSVVGAIGQSLRVLVGLKKAQEDAVAQGQSFRDGAFDGVRLGVSLLIGSVVGALTMMTISQFKVVSNIDSDLFTKLLAAGYAGTDLIEGIIQKYLPTSSTSATPKPAPAALTAAPAPGSAGPAVFKSVADAAAVTTDWKPYIEATVAVTTFPACGKSVPGGKKIVDANFDISAQCTANPGNVSNDVNAYAKAMATHYSYTWTAVASTDVQKLKTVQDLMTLVGKNLA